jgi:hypothetical protein
LKKREIKKITILIAILMFLNIVIGVIPSDFSAKAAEAPVNLAKVSEANVTAESKTSTRLPKYVVDGDRGTTNYWKNSNVSEINKDISLTIDLGIDTEINKIYLKIFVESTGKMNNFRVYGSIDGKSWDNEPIVSSYDSSKLTNKSEFVYNVTSKTVRYVKFTNEVGSTTGGSGLYEIEIYNDPLNNKISEAQVKHNTAVEGNEAGNYQVGSKSALQAAIGSAKAVRDNVVSTAVQLGEALAALNTAIEVFEEARVTGSGSEPTPVKSNDADLSSLVVTGGNLDKSFDKAVTEYILDVAEEVTSVNITAVASSPVAQIKVGDTTVVSGQAIELVVLETTTSAAITVTAEDGTTKTYILTVKKSENNPDVPSGPFKFVVSEDTYIDGTAGVPSGSITPYVDTNFNSKAELNIKGTYQTSTPKNNRIGYLKYVINVSEGKAVNKANLKFYVTGVENSNAKLRVVGFSNNNWDEDTLTWKTAPDYSWNELQQTSKTLDATSPYGPYGTLVKDFSTVDIIANTWISVDVSEFVKAQTEKGINTISFKVYDPNFAIKDLVANSFVKIQARAGEAADDDKLSYIEIEEGIPLKSTNADLSKLTVTPGNLQPAFDKDTTSYNATVAKDVISVDITLAAADSKAKIKVGDAVVNSGDSVKLEILQSTTNATITVIAEDGVTTKTYTVTVNKLNTVERSGDINGNGVVDAGDLAYIAFRNGKNTENTTPEEWKLIENADINRDGKLDEADISILLSKGGV